MTNIVATSLNSYVSQKGKSLSQVAYYLEVSKGHLSEIRNLKKLPSLDLGLRILNYTKATDEQKREWIETSTVKISKNYEHLAQTESLDREKVYIKENLGRILSLNLDLTLIFMDILNSDGKGITQVRILNEYGRNNLLEILKLVELNYLILENSYLKLSEGVRLVFDRQSSHDLMRSIFSELKKQELLQNKKAQFQFEIDDISDEGAEELKKINKEAMEKAAAVFKRHSLKRSLGGTRYIFQVLSARLQGSIKMFVLLFCLMFALTSNHAFAKSGGVEGGGSTESITINDGIEGGSSDFIIPNFKTNEEAKKIGTQISEKIKKGQVKELQEKVEKNCYTPGSEKVQAKITPLKLRVIPKFELGDGESKFDARIEYEVRCNRNPML